MKKHNREELKFITITAIKVVAWLLLMTLFLFLLTKIINL